MWIHDRFVENEEYAGIIVSVSVSASWVFGIDRAFYGPQIPPPPPKPDFDEPRHKLAKLREGNPYTHAHTHPITPPPHTPPHVMCDADPGLLSQLMCDTIMSLCCEGEEALTKEEYTKMKQELEA